MNLLVSDKHQETNIFFLIFFLNIIIDAEAEKPADWDEEPLIPDPDDEKPDDWVDVPRTIPDPKAEKPDDWDGK